MTDKETIERGIERLKNAIARHGYDKKKIDCEIGCYHSCHITYDGACMGYVKYSTVEHRYNNFVSLLSACGISDKAALDHLLQIVHAVSRRKQHNKILSTFDSISA